MRTRLLFRLALAAGIAGAFFWLFARQVDLAVAWAGVSRMPASSTLLAIALIVASFGFMALRWHFLFRSAGARPPLSILFPASCLGSGLNNLVPARGGDLVRIESTRQKSGVPGFLIAGTLAVERLLDGVTLAVIIVAGALLLGELGRFLAIGLVLAGGATLGVALAAAAVARPALVERPGRRLVRRLPGRWRRGALVAGANFMRGLAVVRAPWPLLAAFVASALMWASQAGAYVALGRGLGLDVGVGAYLLLKGIGQLAFAFPATIAGLGVFDYVLLAAGRGLGLGADEAGAFTLAAHVFDVVPITALGLVFLWWAFPRFGRGRLVGRRHPG